MVVFVVVIYVRVVSFVVVFVRVVLVVVFFVMFVVVGVVFVVVVFVIFTFDIKPKFRSFFMNRNYQVLDNFTNCGNPLQSLQSPNLF